MLAAPPVDGVRDEEEGGGRERSKLLLPSTETEEPPPFHVDSKEVEPRLCSRRLSPMPNLSLLRLTEEEGSDRRPDFKDNGARSEP